MTSSTLQSLRKGNNLETLGLAMATGMVLADSSIVILALPEILREYDIEIAAGRVGHHVVQPRARAVGGARRAARPAPPARGLRGRPAGLRRRLAGLRAGAVASRCCVAARCVQAIGGAAVVCAALELLPRTTGSEARAVAAWATAGALGAAIGPALGGALTEAISWQAIFIAQTPAGPARDPGAARPVADGRSRRPRRAAPHRAQRRARRSSRRR